ncbi:hypothetical protein E2986_05799 [Frieseomelitta varia]|uniref:Uncharacterized protein n=1 Tax=Frieseomelitta varia TaxID=561572 RepID=A0A833S8C9_9HYME|nr:hypothetical protein E2986_05799 [Frieseomelitta varia]
MLVMISGMLIKCERLNIQVHTDRHTDELKKKATSYCIRFGHSLWSAISVISYRRIEKESDELLYTVWSLVTVRNQLPAQVSQWLIIFEIERVFQTTTFERYSLQQQ